MMITTIIGPPQYPQSPDEWQLAADASHALLTIHAAQKYGLITGGPDVDIERCNLVLECASRRGITPAKDAFARYLGEYEVEIV